MNKINKEKFNKVRQTEVDVKMWNYFIEKLKFKQYVIFLWHVAFRTRRGVLFYSCLDMGMSVFSAYNVSFTNGIDTVINCLVDHGWSISFGKLD